MAGSLARRLGLLLSSGFDGYGSVAYDNSVMP